MVVQALGKLAGTAVTVSELSDLTTLAAHDSGISDLTGLELAIYLEDLDLSGNALSDLSPLAGLNDLERLDLSNNAIREIAERCSSFSTAARFSSSFEPTLWPSGVKWQPEHLRL